MSRKRPTQPVPLTPDAELVPERSGRRGGERLAWSYLAAVLVGVIVGLALVIAIPISSGTCATADDSCPVGVQIMAALIGGIVGSVGIGLATRLGWEWVLACCALITAVPWAMDIAGPVAWVYVALIPAIVALATWRGDDGPRWRPIVVAVVSVALIVASVLVTFVL